MQLRLDEAAALLQRTHVTQIARVMAKRCGDDVGPWRAHLRVLQP